MFAILIYANLCCWSHLYENSFILTDATESRFSYSTGLWQYRPTLLAPWTGVGRLDVFGRTYANCYEYPNNPDMGTSAPALIHLADDKTPVFKYISGRVIPGQLEGKPFSKSKFIPKVGGKIISIHQYLASDNLYVNHKVPRLKDDDDYQGPFRMVVYNLPAQTTRLKKAITEMASGTKLHSLPVPAKLLCSETPTNSKQNAKGKYHFVRDDNKCKFIARVGVYFYEGKVENGEFYPDFSLPVQDDNAKDYPIYRKPLIPNEQVYECYSDALIPGYLYKIPKGEILLYSNFTALHKRAADDDYVFVPTTGATVISLQQYLDVYVPGKSKRIHNLPGTIEEKK